MKKFLLLCLRLLICGTAAAQPAPSPQPLDRFKVVDSTRIEVRYVLQFKHHAAQAQPYEDIRVLQIGRQTVKEYSDIVYHYDSLATENFRKGLPTQSNTHVTHPYELFTYPRTRTLQVKHRLLLNAGVLCYEAPYPAPVWQFSAEAPVEVAGYTCGRATTRWGGRTYVAWYTTDIPLPYGPYKFHGLPGLVLRVEEAGGMYRWEAFSIRQCDAPICLYTYEREQRCSQQEADKTVARMMRHPLSFLYGIGSKVMVRQADGRFAASTAKNEAEIPYEPMEREEKEEAATTRQAMPLAIDSLPPIKNLTEIRIRGRRVLLTFDLRGGYGEQSVWAYSLDAGQRRLCFEREYFPQEDGYYRFFAPVLCEGEGDTLCVTERDNPTVYRTTPDGQAERKGERILSSSARIPYPLVMDVRQLFWQAPHTYLFPGRERAKAGKCCYRAAPRAIR